MIRAALFALILSAATAAWPNQARAGFGLCNQLYYWHHFDGRFTGARPCDAIGPWDVNWTAGHAQMRVILDAAGTVSRADPLVAAVQNVAESLSSAMSQMGALRLRDISVLITDLPPERDPEHPGRDIAAIARAFAPSTADYNPPDCQVIVYRTAASGGGISVQAFKFALAHEVFHCIQYTTWPDDWKGADSKWWIEGTAQYFADLVYPGTAYVGGDIRGFESSIRDAALTTLEYSSVVFWFWYAQTHTPADIYPLISGLPVSGASGQDAQQMALRNFINVDDWTAFEEAYLDQTIMRAGSTAVRVDHLAQGRIEPVSEDRELPYFVHPFTLSSARISFAAGAVYTIQILDPAPELKMQWSESVGTWGDAPTSVSTCDSAREFRIVLGSVSSVGNRRVRIHREDDERACCPPRPGSSLAECADSGTGSGGGSGGRSYGEPHIVTYDANDYSFQTMGEYVLTRAGDGFEVQTRQEKLKDMDVSVNTAAAVRIGSHHAAFYAHEFKGVPTSTSRAYIDGAPMSIGEDGIKLGDATIRARGDNAYDVDFAGGRHISIDFFDWDGAKYLDIDVELPKSERAAFTGLLGNHDGDPKNDLRIQNGGLVAPDRSTYRRVATVAGQALPVPVPLDAAANAYNQQLNRKFGDSWRVTDASTLFDYGAGQSSASFTDTTFPKRFFSLGSLDQQAVADAEAACHAAMVPTELINGCIYDVAVTGSKGFANSLAQFAAQAFKRHAVEEIRRRLPPVPVPIPFP